MSTALLRQNALISSIRERDTRGQTGACAKAPEQCIRLNRSIPEANNRSQAPLKKTVRKVEVTIALGKPQSHKAVD